MEETKSWQKCSPFIMHLSLFRPRGGTWDSLTFSNFFDQMYPPSVKRPRSNWLTLYQEFLIKFASQFLISCCENLENSRKNGHPIIKWRKEATRQMMHLLKCPHPRPEASKRQMVKWHMRSNVPPGTEANGQIDTPWDKAVRSNDGICPRSPPGAE